MRRPSSRSAELACYKVAGERAQEQALPETAAINHDAILVLDPHH